MSLVIVVLIILLVAVVALYLVGQVPDAQLQQALRIIVIVLALVWLILELYHHQAVFR